jgi:hypothetical protein
MARLQRNAELVLVAMLGLAVAADAQNTLTSEFFYLAARGGGGGDSPAQKKQHARKHTKTHQQTNTHPRQCHKKVRHHRMRQVQLRHSQEQARQGRRLLGVRQGLRAERQRRVR